MADVNVSVKGVLAEFVEERVRSGAYESATEVVQEALRLLRRDEQIAAMKLELLRREVARGVDDANAGRFATESLDELAARALQEAQEELQLKDER
jgi:antitoxin ParD1/3/4